MTQEDKELLLKDLSARLPYNVKVWVKFYGDYSDEVEEHVFVLNSIDTKYPSCWYWIGGEQVRECGLFDNGVSSFAVDMNDEDQDVKPYLRPMSSMTEEEVKEEENTVMMFLADFYYAHHLDFHGLIPKGLALEAPEGMYQ